MRACRPYSASCRSVFVADMSSGCCAVTAACVLLQGARGKTHFSYANVQGFHAAMSRFYQRKHGLETGGEDTSANMQTNGFAPADSPCKDKWVGLLRGE